MPFTFSTGMTNYAARRYPVVRTVEEPGGVVHTTAYKDSKGYATIGAGFKVDSWATKILENMSLTGVNGTNRAKVATAITSATRDQSGNAKVFATDAAVQTAINDALNNALNLTVPNRISFAFANTAEVSATFDAIAKTFEDDLDAWYGSHIPEGRERLALLSMAYNNIVGVRTKDAVGNPLTYKSPGLRQAMISGDRAEAWFQIRYG